jgi:hypothetical protein
MGKECLKHCKALTKRFMLTILLFPFPKLPAFYRFGGTVNHQKVGFTIRFTTLGVGISIPPYEGVD